MKKFSMIFITLMMTFVVVLSGCDTGNNNKGNEEEEDVTATTGSWTLTGITITIPANEATTDDDGVLSTVTTLGSTATGLVEPLVLNYNTDLTSTLFLVMTNGTGVGITKGSTTKDITRPANGAAYKYNTSNGLCIKRDALKIEGVKGNVQVTIKWFMNSKAVAGNRKLEVTFGDGTTIEGDTPDTSAKTADCPDFVEIFDGGSEGKTLYIGASNEVYIKEIIIEAADE
jgi:hypothetical protein